MNTMKEVNDQQKEMALKKKIYLLPVPALLLCLYLAACSSLVDTRSFDSAGDDGLAYHDGDGLIYPAGWIPEKIYDPAKDWGTDWMNNWGV